MKDLHVTTALLLILIAVAVGLLVAEVGAQAKPPRTQSTDTAFIIPVVKADGSTVDVGVTGFSSGLNLACVLVSETGSVAVLSGACPRR